MPQVRSFSVGTTADAGLSVMSLMPHCVMYHRYALGTPPSRPCPLWLKRGMILFL